LSLDFGLSKNEFDDIKQFILSMYPKWNDFPKDISGLVEYMKNDKKNLDENINFTVLKSIGNSDVDQHINIEKIIESLYYYKAL
jgi:3-dehydroquinate synthase